jgi:hypothetical protein
VYSHCLFCQKTLGSNDVLEAFPVGRRIAFDTEKGRLWVICRRCERWNLTPLEERWEAIEHAERLYRDTRLRASTEHIGLARLNEGLELVRIGRPLRPEFAAWRYGDQFGRRRRKALAVGAGAAGVIGFAAPAGIMLGAISLSLAAAGLNTFNLWEQRRTRARVPVGFGEIIKIRSRDLSRVRLFRAGTGELAMEFHGTEDNDRGRIATADQAERIAAILLPKINSTGATRKRVQEAVQALERVGGPEPYLRSLLERPPLPSWQSRSYHPGDGFTIFGLPLPHRLALEMALHEQQERCALDGELRALTLAWRTAEEIAGIADGLLVPATVWSKLRRHRMPHVS